MASRGNILDVFEVERMVSDKANAGRPREPRTDYFFKKKSG